MNVNYIKRAEVGPKLVEHWLATKTPRELLAMHEPDWERLRNYEMEERLVKAFGGAWCVEEYCPFNGRFGTWQGDRPSTEVYMARTAKEQAEFDARYLAKHGVPNDGS